MSRRLFRFVDRPRLKVQLQWEPSDLWVGCFWRTRNSVDVLPPSGIPPPWFIHIYVCLVPLLPLHITILRSSRPRKFFAGVARDPGLEADLRKYLQSIDTRHRK